MNKRWILGTLGLLLAVLTCTGLSWAGNRTGAFTLTPMVGGYVFDSELDVDDDVAYGLSLGYNFTKNWSAELNGLFISTENDDSGDDVDFYQYSLNALYNFRPDHNFVPFLTAGIGGTTLDPDTPGETWNSNGLFTWGGGAKYFFAEDFALRADVRHNLSFDSGQNENNFSYTAGLHMQFGGGEEAMAPRDSDGDGVPDDMDKCPGTPRGVKVDAHGCPVDSDGDGVPDYLDQCPGTPKGTMVDAKGCPPPAPAPAPEPAPVPVPVPVPVPAPMDSDGDGVTDDLDKCPDTERGFMVDKDGCPLTYTLHINFDFDKAEIKPQYHGDLAGAADFIKKNPAAKILVAGHTDSIGTEAYNQKLSMRRAEAVRSYLIKNFGIAPDLLVVRGFGESKPVASNETKEGRAQNRRVDITCCYVIPEM